MTEVFKRQIIKLLRHSDYRPIKLSKLAKTLGISDDDYLEFKAAFEHLRQAGHLVIGTKEAVSLPPIPSKITGTFRPNPKGFGFITPLEINTYGDLFVPPNATANAMAGDVVTATVQKRGIRAGQIRYTGRITDILERAQNRFVGTLTKTAQGWFVLPDGSAFNDLIAVEGVTAKSAKENDKVITEIITYPKGRFPAQGVITEVIGKKGSYDTEIKSIIAQFHLPGEFDEACLDHVRKAAAEFDPAKLDSREDITDKLVITIDPAEAKDFDDAISLEKDSNNKWVLGVHIADVSHFIKPGTPLDAEAKLRGNSAYLPGRTIPMLPEVLSNGLCSLQPDQLRFCKSIYLTYDKNANILDRRYANSLIRSKQRLTYLQATKILDGHKAGMSAEVIELLKNMETLSRLIEKRRNSEGMLHLDLPETELIMDKAGQVVDACPADTSYSHTLIEMFMVEANDAAASLFEGLKIPFMRRIHPSPNPLSMKNLAKVVKTFGYDIHRKPDRAAIQGLLSGVEGTDSSVAVNLIVLRSFEKAEYSPLEIGHYALASKDYCHFTSPIRRYADLLIHRLLDSYIRGKVSAKQQLSSDELTEIGKHITYTEQQADSAERELKAVLILQMLSKHIGDEIDCVVTGLTSFGVFAKCKRFGIEGLIPMAELGPDEWQFDAKRQCISGAKTGVGIRLGRPMKVRIISVNIPARQLNLTPAERLVSKKARAETASRNKKRNKSKPTRRTRRRK